MARSCLFVQPEFWYLSDLKIKCPFSALACSPCSPLHPNLLGIAGRLPWVGTQFSPGFLRGFSLILRRDPGEVPEKSGRILRKKTNQAQSSPKQIPNMSASWSIEKCLLIQTGLTFEWRRSPNTSGTLLIVHPSTFFRPHVDEIASPHASHSGNNPDKSRLNKTL